MPQCLKHHLHLTRDALQFLHGSSTALSASATRSVSAASASAAASASVAAVAGVGDGDGGLLLSSSSSALSTAGGEAGRRFDGSILAYMWGCGWNVER